MRAYLKGVIVAVSLLCAGVLVSPSAQVQIQRGWSTAYNLTVQNLALFADGTRSAPGIAYAAAPSWGFYRDGSFGLVASVADTDVWTTDSAALVLSSSKSLRWGSSTFNTPDLILSRDGVGVLLLNHSVRYSGIAFASLGTPTNGTVTYCTDCTPNVSPCTGAGTGAIAKRLNAAWDCR